MFATDPVVRNTTLNLIGEMIGTAVLVFIILEIEVQDIASDLGTLFVGLLIWGIGLSLGALIYTVLE